MNKRFFLGILIMIAVSFGFSCKSKTVVKKLANKNTRSSSKTVTNKIDGVMYHLPKTIVQVTIPVTKVTKEPGEFVKFAPCFFSDADLKKIITAVSQEVSVGAPTFSTRGVPDTSETYVISTKGKYFETKSLLLEYAPGSLILAKGESESKNEALDFTMKAIATAASIGSKALVAAMDGGDQDTKKKELSEEYACYQKLPAGAIATGVKTDVENDLKRSINYPGVAKMTDDDTLNLLKAPNPTRSDYQRANDLHKNLQNLITARDTMFSTGGNNIPPDTFKLMLEKNAAAIKAHQNAFLGLKSETSAPITVEFEPRKGVTENYSSLLFSYSKTKGICKDGQLLEKNIQIPDGLAFSAKGETCSDTTDTKTEALWLKVVKGADQEFLDNVQAAIETSTEEDKSRGWYYRVPANTVVSLHTQSLNCKQKSGAPIRNSCLINSFTITSGVMGGGAVKVITTGYDGAAGTLATVMKGSEIARGESLIAQLGIIASVPASTAGRSNSSVIVLDPATGAMKNFKSSSSALVDKAILDDAAKAANTVIDTADPLTRKKRELDELQTQNKINEEKKKLENSNTDKDQ